MAKKGQIISGPRKRGEGSHSKRELRPFRRSGENVPITQYPKPKFEEVPTDSEKGRNSSRVKRGKTIEVMRLTSACGPGGDEY